MGAAAGFAQPVGSSVVAGQAQVLSAGATTIINQSSSKAIINWQDFSVGAGAAVQFNQPNSASVTLNRVTGSGLSTIDGAIRANGQVWLLNPNGVLFGNNAVINVGGLLATTSDIANQDFLEGRYNFASGRNSVVNNGTIRTSNGGSVILSAPNVVNNGLIQARAGHVVLGGTDTFTVDFNGDRLLSYAVGGNSTGGKVANNGRIETQGGKVLLTARAASGVQDAVINNTGMVEATSVREENGEIVLEADGGAVGNSGTLDASGKGAGETGGTVKVLGRDIAIEDGAKIDVSGDAGGGTALIGGNFHGQGSEAHARSVTVGQASIKADAMTRGNGGKVAVWSDGATQVAANITAKGGSVAGQGGMVETSGHVLGFTGTTVDAGLGGTWLLDPYDLTIDGTAAASINSTLALGTNLLLQTTATGSSAPPGIANPSGNGDIFINAPISWSTGASLGLYAYRNIQFNANVTVSGAGTLAINTGMGASGVPGSSPGDYRFAAGSSAVFISQPSSPVLSVNNSVYTLLYGMSDVQNINTDNTSLGLKYALATSLDATNVSSWVPIGTDGAGNPNNSGNGFTGTFTGLGNTIANFSLNQPTKDYVALFGYSSGALRDIGMVGGTITGNYAVGGLVARNHYGSSIKNAYDTGAVNGTNLYVGGLAGVNYGTITNSYATGAVTNSGDATGGLVGINLGTISVSFASGAVSGSNDIGGLVGQNNGGTITNAYATGAVNASTDHAGGLVGNYFTAGNISNVYATGAVTGGGAANGLIGTNFVPTLVTNGYWDTDTTATDTSGSGATGKTTAQLTAALPSGFSSSVWANGNNQSTPYLPINQYGLVFIGSSYSNLFPLIFTASQLQKINVNPGGNYALGASIDAADYASWVPLGTDGAGTVNNGGAGFSGVFDGLGYTVSNLTLNMPFSYVGPFGYSSGTIRNVGMVGGSITGNTSVGGLVGKNEGTITNAYATGNINASNTAGGLVGWNNNGSITNSYASGAITSGNNAGGLVGQNNNIVSRAYATGSVSGNQGAGGLIGYNIGPISDVYATGAVIGTEYVGGLAGLNYSAITGAYSTGAVNPGSAVSFGGLVGLDGGTITNGYWDIETSGLTTSPAGTGRTTAQLQGSLPGGFNSTAFGTGSGLFPYLKWRYPSAPQAISGIAYSDGGVTPLASTGSGPVTVSALVDGKRAGSSTTGANGYYYILNPAGSFSGTQNLLTYLDGNAITANYYFQNPSATVTGADLYGGHLRITSGAATVSSMFGGLSTALGSNSGANFLFAGGSIVPGTNVDMSATTTGGLTVDQAIDAGIGAFALTASSAISLAANISASNVYIQTPGNISRSGLTPTIVTPILSLTSSGNIGGAGAPVLVSSGFSGPILLSLNSGGNNATISSATAVTIGNAGVNTGVGAFTLTAAGDIQNAGGAGIVAQSISLSAQGGIGSNNAIPVSAPSGTLSLSVSNADPLGSVYLTSTSAVSVTGGSLSGGSFDLRTDGDLTVNSAITTTSTDNNQSSIVLFSQGSLTLNANVTDDYNDVTQPNSAVFLAAAYGQSPSPTAAISGTGIVSASTVAIQLGSSSGAIGSQQNPILLNTAGSAVGLTISTAGQDAFIRSQKPVMIASVDGTLGISGIDLRNINPQLNPGNFTLSAAGQVTQGSILQVNNLNVSTTGSGSDILLTTGNPNSSNAVTGTAVFNTGAGSGALFQNGSDITLGASTVGGSFTVTADTGNVNQAGPISAGDLSLYAVNGSINLPHASNAVRGNIYFASAETGSITFNNSVDTTLTNVRGQDPSLQPVLNAAININVRDPAGITHPGLTVTGPVQSHGAVTLAASGYLTLTSNALLISEARGDAIILATDGNFSNLVGSSVLALTGGGRFLVFSAGPSGDVFGNLDSQNTAIFATSYPSSIAASGNRYVFALQPTLTVSATNATKIYGVDNSASLQNGYTISGVQAGVAGAYLADSAPYGGTPSLTSTGAPAGANVGTYVISVGAGNFVAANYTVIYQNGQLTVTPQTLTYAANSATRLYGAADPAFSGSVTGFVNNDTLASATSGTLAFVTPATAASRVGVYALNGSGLSASNYVFVQAAGNASALTINPATLLYLANAVTRTVGAANPAFGGSVTGFANGESLASATSGILLFTSSANAASPAGAYAVTGSGLQAVNYIFAQAPANATALTVSAAVADTPPLTLPDDSIPGLTGFTVAIQPPRNSPLNAPLGGGPTGPTPPLPPAPPPPPPPPQQPGPLASNNTDENDQPAEAPNSSDGTTNKIADSLEGGEPSGEGGTVVIPKMLTSGTPPPPPPTDISALSSFGNSALWQ